MLASSGNASARRMSRVPSTQRSAEPEARHPLVLDGRGDTGLQRAAIGRHARGARAFGDFRPSCDALIITPRPLPPALERPLVEAHPGELAKRRHLGLETRSERRPERLVDLRGPS